MCIARRFITDPCTHFTTFYLPISYISTVRIACFSVGGQWVWAIFLMEVFEKRALEQATHRPLCRFYYVDHTFVIWLNGTEKLERFLDRLNGLHRNLQFTIEMEKEHFPSFLDIDIYRRPDGFLGHKVYWKLTHKNLYQKLRSHRHSSDIQAILSTLVHRARALGDSECLHDELEFLMTTWRDNGCSLNVV